MPERLSPGTVRSKFRTRRRHALTTRTLSPMGKSRLGLCGVTSMVVKNGSTIRAMSCRIACFLLRLQVGVAQGPAAARRTNIVDRLDIFWVASAPTANRIG